MQRAEATALLRRAGLRVTAPRVAVLIGLAQTPHTDVDTIRRGVLERLGSVSTQTIYDVLHTFGEAGLVRRLDPAGGRSCYELDSGDDHHHLVCRRCHAIADVPHAADRPPCPVPEDTHGYLVEKTEIQDLGLCPACQEPPARRPPTEE